MTIILLKLKLAGLMLLSAFSNPQDVVGKNNAINYANRSIQEAVTYIKLNNIIMEQPQESKSNLSEQNLPLLDQSVQQAIGTAPDNNIVQMVKSCELNVIRVSQNQVTLEWSSIGLPEGIIGKIYSSNGQDGGNIIYQKIDDVKSYGKMENVQYGNGYFKLTFGETNCYKNI